MKQGKQPKQAPHLSGAEYVSSDQSESTEISGARWEFMCVVRCDTLFPALACRWFEAMRSI